VWDLGFDLCSRFRVCILHYNQVWQGQYKPSLAGKSKKKRKKKRGKTSGK